MALRPHPRQRRPRAASASTRSPRCISARLRPARPSPASSWRPKAARPGLADDEIPRTRRDGEEGLPGLARAGRRPRHHAEGDVARGRRMPSYGAKIMEAASSRRRPPRSCSASTTSSSTTIPPALPHWSPRTASSRTRCPRRTAHAMSAARHASALWRGIATAPGTRFDLEETFVAGDRATIRWRYWWGEGQENSVRGVNLMRVSDGRSSRRWATSRA